MRNSMSPIDRLTEMFEHFPGIGPRQARRFVQYLLASPQTTRASLAELVARIGAEVSQCKKCFRWSAGKAPLCTICSNTARDISTLFVIEKDADLDNVEGSGYKGLYFVLGGTIPLASEEPGKYVRLTQLLTRAEEPGLKEIILGLSATTEGDHTRQILAEKLKTSKIKISSLGRGLSTGSELEYADPETIAQALGNRH